jgi:hypothetical protein
MRHGGRNTHGLHPLINYYIQEKPSSEANSRSSSQKHCTPAWDTDGVSTVFIRTRQGLLTVQILYPLPKFGTGGALLVGCLELFKPYTCSCTPLRDDISSQRCLMSSGQGTHITRGPAQYVCILRTQGKLWNKSKATPDTSPRSSCYVSITVWVRSQWRKPGDIGPIPGSTFTQHDR